ncbi:MAG: lysine--tRNA ligase, partial [Candidatus Izemoplasmatales bacterium]
MENKLSEQEIIRREKATDLSVKGLDPYGQRFDRTHNTETFKAQYGHLKPEDLEAMGSLPTIKIAGRIMTKRTKGK